jgi:hypothetical protein
MLSFEDFKREKGYRDMNEAEQQISLREFGPLGPSVLTWVDGRFYYPEEYLYKKYLNYKKSQTPTPKEG